MSCKIVWVSRKVLQSWNFGRIMEWEHWMNGRKFMVSTTMNFDSF